MLGEMIIRPVTIDDRDAHVQLYEAVAAEGRWIAAEVPLSDRDEIYRRVNQALTDPQVAMLVADDNGRSVGFLGMQNRGGVVEFGMFLDPAYRGAGIGGQLLDAAISRAREFPAHKMMLEVWPHNGRAIALYERHGFVVEGRLARHYRRRNGEMWDAVVMGLVLELESPGSPFQDE